MCVGVCVCVRVCVNLHLYGSASVNLYLFRDSMQKTLYLAVQRPSNDPVSAQGVVCRYQGDVCLYHGDFPTRVHAV